MHIPGRLPGLKVATLVLGIYTAAWISLEGELWRVVVMGLLVTAVSMGFLWQRYLGGHTISMRKWLALAAASGLILGLGSGLLTLIFMSMKTGLHAHGPEFTPSEIAWVVNRIPLWSVAGLLAGLGIGLAIGQAPPHR